MSRSNAGRREGEPWRQVGASQERSRPYGRRRRRRCCTKPGSWRAGWNRGRTFRTPCSTPATELLREPESACGRQACRFAFAISGVQEPRRTQRSLASTWRYAAQKNDRQNVAWMDDSCERRRVRVATPNESLAGNPSSARLSRCVCIAPNCRRRNRVRHDHVIHRSRCGSRFCRPGIRKRGHSSRSACVARARRRKSRSLRHRSSALTRALFQRLDSLQQLG